MKLRSPGVLPVGLGLALAPLLFLALAAGLFALVQPEGFHAARAALMARVNPEGWWMVALVAAAWWGCCHGVVWLGWRQLIWPVRQLHDVVRLQHRAATSGVGQVSSRKPVRLRGSPDHQRLGLALDQLLADHHTLQAELHERTAEASRRMAEERNRLAALMSELTQGVVVCSLDGRIVLFNPQARAMFRIASPAESPSASPAESPPGAALAAVEPIALGRSIYGLIDRRVVAHALDTLSHRQAAQAPRQARFVSSLPGGQLVRVQLAPVGGDTTGFVLMLDDITESTRAQAERDRWLQGIAQAGRSSLGRMQTALDTIDRVGLSAALLSEPAFPGAPPAPATRALGILRAEARDMDARLRRLQDYIDRSLKTAWPLDDMPGAELLSMAARAIGSATRLQVKTDVPTLAHWLRVDSYSLVQAIVWLAARLEDEYGLRSVRLRLRPVPGQSQRAHLDLVWTGQPMSTETAMNWELDPIWVEGENTGNTVREICARHDGAFEFGRERVRFETYFRLLLPVAPARLAERLEPGRPEFYDFDLFQPVPQGAALEARSLASLHYTVFDTETTGLNPSQGDEIIQLGAVRIVNGRILRDGMIDQLVDPGRPIPPASIPIHGIEPARLKGQPPIARVLPVFHAFAQDTVLVAHNAAFDMRFLQLKEAATGLKFDQPVLDTLLLSAVVHPNEPSHSLEALTERFGIEVRERHTAAGDAWMTAEIFLRLLPLLHDMGITTLGAAREAARKTWYARLQY